MTYTAAQSSYDFIMRFHPFNNANEYISMLSLDDHNRVKLRALAGKDAKHSDYINANYVDVSITNRLLVFLMQVLVWFSFLC